MSKHETNAEIEDTAHDLFLRNWHPAMSPQDGAHLARRCFIAAREIRRRTPNLSLDTTWNPNRAADALEAMLTSMDSIWRALFVLAVLAAVWAASVVLAELGKIAAMVLS